MDKFHPVHKGRKSSQKRGSRCQGRGARKSLARLGSPECGYMTGVWRGALGFGSHCKFLKQGRDVRKQENRAL